ncbi:MAG: transcriptional repressor [Candidatus Firestonebacteria bacterium]|nr:transcriptional repressor [Candidatus Firestonebacteria bacterium]
MENEIKFFSDFLSKRKLKNTLPRVTILKIFLSTEKHLTLEELYNIIKKQDPIIGFSTVYRNMKLLCECHLAREIHLDDNKIRYEHNYEHKHHDHFVCNVCNKSIEFLDEDLELLQNKISKKYKFTPQSHRLIVYGICDKCKKSKE